MIKEKNNLKRVEIVFRFLSKRFVYFEVTQELRDDVSVMTKLKASIPRQEEIIVRYGYAYESFSIIDNTHEWRTTILEIKEMNI